MIDDIQYNFRRVLNSRSYELPHEDLRNYVLLSLEDLLNKNCTTLSEKKLPQPRGNLINPQQDKLILEELNYNHYELAQEHL